MIIELQIYIILEEVYIEIQGWLVVVVQLLHFLHYQKEKVIANHKCAAV